jgi:plastocyanin
MNEPTTRRGLLRSVGAGVTSVGVAAFAGCLGASSGERVAMTDGLVFDPGTVAVAPGDTVQWTNEGDIPHTVTAYESRLPAGARFFASGGFETERAARNDIKGGLIHTGETFEHVFEVAGSYAYFCVPHEGSRMIGTVRVD